LIAPDRLLPSRVRGYLRTQRFGGRLFYYPDTDSTNRAALSLARAGEPSGTVVVADHQSKGRGRLDHEWSSRAGEDLLYSIILRPGSPPPDLLPITLVFSNAVSTELSGLLGEVVSVEWPNDMVTQGGKIGGILAEGTVASSGDSFLVVGVGLNVNSRFESFSDALRPRVATCRTVTGRTWDRAELLAIVLGAMERDYTRFLSGGFAAMRAQYEHKLVFLGRRVSFVHRDRQVVATVEGVEDDGALRVVAEDTNQRMKLYSEEVHPVA
jgi:BirA family biotin operon repressor/biotin-[acetyl-CoA-carboxylase] ligase